MIIINIVNEAKNNTLFLHYILRPTVLTIKKKMINSSHNSKYFVD